MASQPIVSAATIQHVTGIRFKPTDQDLVWHYLRPRSVNEPLPSEIIGDMDILGHNPWDLVPEGCTEKYFFSQRVLRWPHGSQWNRAAGNGYYKTSGKVVSIFSTGINGGENEKIGLKRTLVFYQGRTGVGQNTEWMMQEYCLVEAGLKPYRVMKPSGSKKNDNFVNPDDSWVVCHIYKKRKYTQHGITQVYNNAEGRQVPFYNFFEQ